MKDLIFVTGNQHKADYLVKWLGMPVEHQKVSLDELQSLDLREVVEHKARGAYEIIKRPVLVEDVALTFTAMGRLPGTFIKWFLEEVGTDGLCKIAQGLEHQRAAAGIMYGLFDGEKLTTFEVKINGTIVPEPQVNGDDIWHSALSWNSIFMPDGSNKTYSEMTDDELRQFGHRAQAIEKLRDFLA